LFTYIREYMTKNKVKQFREAIPLSIAELARRAGLAPQTVTKMEKGLPTRKYSELKVAKALQKKYKDVFLSDAEF
jgi:DNA-binding XRE family transcriptional regulator